MEEKKFIFPGIRRLFIYVMEKYCPFNIKTFQILVGIITAILLGTVLVLGWTSSKKIREVVTKDFNQQQLVLAQHAARQIESNLNILKKELSLLGLSPSIQYFEKVWLGKRMEITFSRIKEEGILEIRYIESKGSRMHLVDSHGYQTAQMYPEDLSYLEWARQIKNKNNTLISEVSPVIHGNDYQKLIMKMVVPVRQISVDETNPVATNKFSGVLLFIVDATGLIENITKGIKSGKTGYAWVMDEKGSFLYHPEMEFIGKNAFEARKAKKPTISFARINEIQKEMMLTGKEGMSWYISGWHRGQEGEMKKLIAYTPIHLTVSEKPLWSVAVVAPVSEVEDAIHSIQIRQFSLQAIIIVVILLGGVTIIFLILNWSTAMEQEVERKTVELKKSEQRYKSLVENAEDIIFAVDQHGNYLSINKFGARFFNKKPENIIGKNMSEILSWPTAEELAIMIQEVFNTKESRQITHPLKIGEHVYWLNTNLRRLWDEEGNIYAVLGISRDITERKKMEEQMFHTEKLASVGTLSAGVAHEINNPLAIILGFTDLLLEKTPQNSESYETLKTIEKQGLNAKRVVENLLSFTRFSEHKEENMDINKNIEAVLAVVGNTLSINKIKVQKKLSDLPVQVKGNAGELQQVFFNIINNAVSAMKGGGDLTISTRYVDEGRNVEIKISDTGIGIKKEHSTKIFDPLFTTKKVGEGTGLGLFVSYGIITKHGGTITFETRTAEEAKETGTSFIITLPAVKTVNSEQ
ncbi:MAG: sensory box sensor histidine kinase [Nitrospirae bacterium]|nr:MAG: sensory box sensor histidine kinase [Nitrospirota bacterium]